MDRDYWIASPSHYNRRYWDRMWHASDAYWLAADEDTGWTCWYL